MKKAFQKPQIWSLANIFIYILHVGIRSKTIPNIQPRVLSKVSFLLLLFWGKKCHSLWSYIQWCKGITAKVFFILHLYGLLRKDKYDSNSSKKAQLSIVVSKHASHHTFCRGKHYRLLCEQGTLKVPSNYYLLPSHFSLRATRLQSIQSTLEGAIRKLWRGSISETCMLTEQ